MPLITTAKLDVQIIEQTTNVICDKCGESYDMSTRHSPLKPGSVPDWFQKWPLSGGYDSTFPRDLDSLTLVVCDPCVQKWVSTFKHQPVIRSAISINPEPVWLSCVSQYWLYDRTLCTEQYPANSMWEQPIHTSEPDPEGPYEGQLADTKTDTCTAFSQISPGADVLVNPCAAGGVVEVRGTAQVFPSGAWHVVYRHLKVEAACWQAMPLADWHLNFATMDTDL